MLVLGVAVAALAAVATAQLRQEHTTPVPILKQINRHNEDGSYSYGYEGADGSFKIETKFPDGQVLGKYGYVDDTGKVREVSDQRKRDGRSSSLATRISPNLTYSKSLTKLNLTKLIHTLPYT